MNLNLLYSFVNVIELQSLTKAARKLHLTQPAVTKHIQALELRFGTKLLDRNSDSKPTPEGALLYKHAKTIIETLEQTDNEIQYLCETMHGHLTIGASTIPGQYLMPKILGLFKTKYPEAQVSLEISSSQEVLNKILDEEILLGAIGNKVSNPKLFLQEFYRDTLIFIASPDSPYGKKSLITADDIKKHPLIWREKGSGTRKSAEALLKASGINICDLNLVMELNSTEAIITSVEAGLGISLISKCAAQRALDNKSLVALQLENVNLERTLYIVALKSNLKRKLISTFLDETSNFSKK